jgi:hypothetical protein
MLRGYEKGHKMSLQDQANERANAKLMKEIQGSIQQSAQARLQKQETDQAYNMQLGQMGPEQGPEEIGPLTEDDAYLQAIQDAGENIQTPGGQKAFLKAAQDGLKARAEDKQKKNVEASLVRYERMGQDTTAAREIQEAGQSPHIQLNELHDEEKENEQKMLATEANMPEFQKAQMLVESLPEGLAKMAGAHALKRYEADPTQIEQHGTAAKLHGEIFEEINIQNEKERRRKAAVAKQQRAAATAFAKLEPKEQEAYLSRIPGGQEQQQAQDAQMMPGAIDSGFMGAAGNLGGMEPESFGSGGAAQRKLLKEHGAQQKAEKERRYPGSTTVEGQADPIKSAVSAVQGLDLSGASSGKDILEILKAAGIPILPETMTAAAEVMGGRQ